MRSASAMAAGGQLWTLCAWMVYSDDELGVEDIEVVQNPYLFLNLTILK